MAAIAASRILDDLLEPVGQCLTLDVAARIAALRADPKTQSRLDALAEKNAEGTLTAKENAEYAAYVEALDVVAILQAVARKALKTADCGVSSRFSHAEPSAG
jgi:hypothetical protein